jgi:hypothetical protein
MREENERILPRGFADTSSALSLTRLDCARWADLSLMRGPRQACAYVPTKKILDIEGRSLQFSELLWLDYVLVKALVGTAKP